MLKQTEYLDNWRYGFIRVDARGRRTYYIRQQVDGRRVKVSTGCHNEKDAVQEYEKWHQDPDGYQPRQIEAPARKAAPELDQALVDAFLAWSAAPKPHGKGNTPGHVADQRCALTWWLTKLGGHDLRRLTIQEIQEPLKGQPAQVLRRKTLKTLYSWLRSEAGGNRVKLAEDPTFKTLEVPTADPTQRSQLNKAVPWEHLQRVKAALTGHWKAVFTVHLATGWHQSELRRFAVRGQIEEYRGPAQAAAVLVCPMHKIGGEFRTAVDAEAKAAALEMQAYRKGEHVSQGVFLPRNYNAEVARVAKALHAADVKAKVPAAERLQPFTAGQIRHSVADHMVSQGADLPSVSTFLNHMSTATTKRFYSNFAVPRNPLLPLKAS